MDFYQKFFSKKNNRTAKELREDNKKLLKKRYQSFQELLTNNNNVLELMGDMEEKLTGEFLFDRHYITNKTSEITAGVKTIIDRLNDISCNKYASLHETFPDIISKIEKFLTRGSEIPVSSWRDDLADAVHRVDVLSHVSFSKMRTAHGRWRGQSRIVAARRGAPCNPGNRD